jgi:hypothetical protein
MLIQRTAIKRCRWCGDPVGAESYRAGYLWFCSEAHALDWQAFS